MSRSYDFLISALRSLPEKPPDDAAQSVKKAYSERMSAVVASALAEELRQRGLIGTRPSGPGEEAGISGAERRMSGGIGAKKVDVTSSARLFRAGDSEREVELDEALDELLALVAERNADFYEFVDDRLRRVQP